MIRLLCPAGVLAVLAFTAPTSGQNCPEMTAVEQAISINRNLLGGPPSDGPILVRRGYITEYNHTHRNPRWVAWYATADYRRTPDRRGRWSTFRADPDLQDPVRADDYNGLFDSADNFARGHLAPYAIAGGDRDGDGALAVEHDSYTPLDIDDQCAVYEFNYMSNISPQYHARFNGFGSRGEPDGLWYQLETEIRELVDAGNSFHIIAGTIFGDSDIQFVGPEQDIGVPDMFYKIIIGTDGAVGFLFTHRRQVGTDGCALDADLSSCVVPISAIESLTGLDFFGTLPESLEQEIQHTEGTDLWITWSN